MKSKRGIKPFLGISVLFILFLSINYYYNHTVLKKALDKYEQEIFYKVRLKINDWTKSNFENVNKMAKIIEDEQLLEEDELSNLLNRLQKNSNFPYIILGTSNGEFYISDKEFITPYNYSPTNRDWFKDAQKEGKTISTKPYYSMRLGLRSVSICTPIEVFGKKSVFCGGQPFKFITDYFVEYASLYNKNIYLLDQDGEILNKIGQTNTLNFEQKNYVKFPVENTRWEIVFEKDNKIYQEHMGEFFIINLLFYAIFVFVYFFTNIFWFNQNKNTK